MATLSTTDGRAPQNKGADILSRIPSTGSDRMQLQDVIEQIATQGAKNISYGAQSALRRWKLTTSDIITAFPAKTRRRYKPSKE